MPRRANIAPLVVVVLALGMATASLGEAAPVSLSDQNTLIELDPASQAGMYTWRVDGIDNMFQRWFWYRIGAYGPESSIDTISAPVVSGFGGLKDGKLTYQNAALTIEVKYSLLGGAPGSLDSDLGEQIKITNKTSNALDFHFFEYTDFDLNHTPSDDTARMISPTEVLQTDATTIIAGWEAVYARPPDHHEININSATRESLNDGAPTTLNDSSGPVGPGDVTWAFEWDLAIAKGSSALISKALKDTPAPVPEPTSLFIIGIGITALRRLERRRLSTPR